MDHMDASTSTPWLSFIEVEQAETQTLFIAVNAAAFLFS
jgi:hypothetical protein